MKARLQRAIPILVVFSYGFTGTTAHATASTHIWAPSTDIQAFKVWHITCDLYVPVAYDASGARIPTVTNVGITVGVLPFKKLKMEVGVDHKSGLGALDNHPLYGNAKIGVPENALGHTSPAIAVGMFDVGTKKDFTDFNVLYGKVGKTVSVNRVSLGRVSLGYFTGNKDLLRGEKGKKDNHGVLAAWEQTVTEVSEKLWICLEYMGTRSAYGSFNLGASWKFAPNVSMIGGYEIYNSSALPSTATLQVDIDI